MADTASSQEHPFVRAQQRGLGPLSAAGHAVWHGDATPCVSCCELVPRSGGRCPGCGQEHTPDMLEKMARHSGPWFVYDHIKPFPGVSFERMTRLVERGAVTRTSIVRGPSTCYQWRFAGEAPIIATLLGHCWRCQAAVTANTAECGACQAPRDGARSSERPTAAGPDPQDAAPSAELAELSIAVSGSNTPRRSGPRRRSGPPLALAFFAISVVVVLCIILILKTSRPGPPPSSSAGWHWPHPGRKEAPHVRDSTVAVRDDAAAPGLREA